MRRKTLLTLVISLLLVVPAVMAMAATADQARDCGECIYDDESTAPVVIAERDQVRDRDQDRADTDGERDQIREQSRLQIHDPASDADQVRARDRDQVRDQATCDGEGLQLREQVRTEKRQQLEFAEPQGEHEGHGPGSGAGNGPLHEGPADGTGNQFGRSEG